MTGLYGKLPSHGDFVQRGLPASFVRPWDEWLQQGMLAAMSQFGDGFAQRWAACPPWRFHLPAGTCGPDPIAGTLLTSTDAVGRRFPLTLARVLGAREPIPDAAWFDWLEELADTVRETGTVELEALLGTAPQAGLPASEGSATGAWMHSADGRHHALSGTPGPQDFVALLAPGVGDGGTAFSERPLAEGLTDRGTVRSRNEDAFADRSDIGLWAVADGAGGHGSGDKASAAATAALMALPADLAPGDLLLRVRSCLAEVHAQLRDMANGGLAPATTIVVLIHAGEHFACLWAGDSRAYLMRDDTLSRLTRDHSVVQELVDAGLLSPQASEGHPNANEITRAIGGSQELELDKVVGTIVAGDRFLLCTDGLFKALPEAEIEQMLEQGHGAKALVERSLELRARDNVTAVLVTMPGPVTARAHDTAVPSPAGAG
jgi:type VI secretion system ImpM family protein